VKLGTRLPHEGKPAVTVAGGAVDRGATEGALTAVDPPIRNHPAAPATRISTAPATISDDEDDVRVAGSVVPQFGQAATTVLTTL
jgi:hypothetical protein